MSDIKDLTQSIRDYSECPICYGTIRTLKMIDDLSDEKDRKIKVLLIELEALQAKEPK